MKMKRALALLLCSVLLLLLSACGGSTPTVPDDDEDGPVIDDPTGDSGRNHTPPQSTEGNVVFRFFGNLQVPDSVNWGDCSLIQLPDGEYILIDACEGGYENYVVQQLKDEGVTHIETAFISHFHSDHYGGLNSFIDAFGIRTVYIDGIELDGSLEWNSNAEPLRGWISALEAKGLTVKTLLAGDSVSFGEVTVECVFPKADTTAATTNDTSNVLLITFKGQRALYTGDLYYSGESVCLQETDNALLKADLLKIMHHGANTSGSAEFIQAVSPKVAVAMGNHIMNSLSLGRYAKVGCDVYQVWETGDVNVMFDGTEIYVWTAQ